MDYIVSDEELRRIPGCTPLKIYIVLNNSPNGATAAMLARQLGCPPSSVFRTLPKLSKAGILSKNGTIYYRNRDKTLTSGKEREKNQKRKEISENNITSSALYIGDEVLFEWLTADAAQLHHLCNYYHLLPVGVEGAAAELDALRPYMEVFITWLRSRGDNLAKKGAVDTRRHFAKWIGGQVDRKKAAEEKSAARTRSVRGQPKTLTEEQQREDMLLKRRRLELAAEQQRHLDEIQRAADSCTDTTARDRVFARFGRKNKQGSG